MIRFAVRRPHKNARSIVEDAPHTVGLVNNSKLVRHFLNPWLIAHQQ
jgi:hypothetical protein